MRSLDEIAALYGVAPRSECTALIDGRLVCATSGEETPLFYPATRERYSILVADDVVCVDAAVKAARKAFVDGPWPRMAVAERNAILREIAARIRAEARQLTALQVIETGIPFSQALATHLPRTAENFEFFADVAATVEAFDQSLRALRARGIV